MAFLSSQAPARPRRAPPGAACVSLNPGMRDRPISSQDVLSHSLPTVQQQFALSSGYGGVALHNALAHW